MAAQRARAATQHARESLRWNLRARAGQPVPRPDAAVLDSLEELTARTRAIARSRPDMPAADAPGQDQASLGTDYATMLRMLAGPVRQLADLRTSPPRAELTAAFDCQDHLERRAARLPGHGDARNAAQRLARLTRDILDEVADHHGQ
jgi:hypothetical protein